MNMETEGVGLIEVLQRIAQALEDANSILVELAVEVMDMHDSIKVTNATLAQIVEELKVTSKLATEQMRLLKLTTPKA